MFKVLKNIIKSNPIVKNPLTKAISQKVNSSFDKIVYGKNK